MGTRLFNGGTQPLVPAGRWGEGVVMPGESIEVDNPESYGPPWVADAEAAAALAAQQRVEDPEALAALQAREDAGATAPSPGVSDGGSEPQDAPENTSTESPAGGGAPSGDGPSLHTLDNGDVVNDAGQVVGHIESPAPAADSTNGGTA